MENFNLNTNLNEGATVNLFNPVIQPETNVVLFKVPEPYIKNKFFQSERRFFEDKFKENKYIGNTQILDYPEVIDIDYSEVSQLDLKYRTGQHCHFFRDGILVCSDRKIKNYFHIKIEDMKNQNYSETEQNNFFKIFDFEDQNHYLEFQYLEKLNRIKDDFNIYVLLPKFSKNKVIKLVFQKNEAVKSVYNYFKTHQKKIENDFSERLNVALLKNYPPDFKKNILYPSYGILDFLHQINSVVNSKKSTFEKILDSGNAPIQKHINPKNILSTSYGVTLHDLFSDLTAATQQFLEKFKKENSKKYLDKFKTYLNKFEDIHPDDLAGISKKIIDIVFNENIPFETVKKNLTLFPEEVLTDRKITQIKVLIMFNTLYAYIHFTKQGTSLPFVGDIDLKNVNRLNYFCFWNWMSGYLLMSGRLEKDNAPMIIHLKEDLENEKDAVEKMLNLMQFHSGRYAGYENIHKIDESIHTNIKTVIEEIENTGTGEWIPYNAAFELRDDPTFKYIRFVEDKENIIFFITDQDENVLVDLYNKKQKDFAYWVYQNLVGYEHVDELYFKVISAIRDWKVLIDRDSSMTYRGRNVPTGVNTSKTREIYLPRVRYHKNPEHTQKVREFYNENRKFSGERRAHVRRLPHGAKPSKLQLLLASKNNIPVPDNHTFVKEALWGTKSMTQKEIRYRTKSLHGLLFVNPQDMQRAEKIDDMSPAAFEENMSKFMGKRGWQIVDRNNYDGGIDIRGFKEFKDGTIKKLIVQCKHWKKAIGPDVIRELIGAKEVEDDGYEKVMMVITSSRFTPGAVEIAEKHNVQLIDGDTLLNEME